MDSSVVTPVETFTSWEKGDSSSGKLHTYNPAADRQAHLNFQHVPLGAHSPAEAPSCQVSMISYNYPKGLMSR